MYDLWSMRLNDRMQKLIDAGLRVSGGRTPNTHYNSILHTGLPSTAIQGGPFGQQQDSGPFGATQDLGPFQGLSHAKPR